jgi:hypothetical protein
MTANEGARVRTRCSWRACVGLNVIGLVIAAGALAGCSLSDGVATFMVDPAQYSVYHCKDLVAQLKNLLDRQKELRDLMGKASEGGGGTVVGTLAYRSEYEKVVGQEKLLRRTAVNKKCELEPPTYQSDQIVR